jgi:uncharacterized protein YqfA (UPF0365 family)
LRSSTLAGGTVGGVLEALQAASRASSSGTAERAAVDGEIMLQC